MAQTGNGAAGGADGGGRTYAAPILHRIVNGTSSTSLDLIRQRPKKSGDPRLFRKSALYSTIIFKYPNFGTGGDAARPVETAIYVPHDAEDPMRGGYGIYLRRPAHRAVLKEFLGIELDSDDPDLRHDVRILDVLDEIPSIDPFLVHSRMHFRGIPVRAGSVSITDAETRALKDLIEARLGPVLLRAFRGKDMTREKVQRMLDAIWDPRLPESTRFVEAFGIHPAECASIFFALQGITYYEHLYRGTTDGTRRLADWLNGPATRPVDMQRYPKFEVERLRMLRASIARELASSYRFLSETFGEYDRALLEFTERDSPAQLRSFLVHADRRFWRLGFSLTAILNLQATVDALARTPSSASRFDTVAATLQQMRVMLEDKASAHAI
jgi:hypothetical protein